MILGQELAQRGIVCIMSHSTSSGLLHQLSGNSSGLCPLGGSTSGLHPLRGSTSSLCPLGGNTFGRYRLGGNTSSLHPLGGSTFGLHILGVGWLGTTSCASLLCVHPVTDSDSGHSPLVAVMDVTTSVQVFGKCSSALWVARTGLLWHPCTMVLGLGVCPLGLPHPSEPDCLVW